MRSAAAVVVITSLSSAAGFALSPPARSPARRSGPLRAQAAAEVQVQLVTLQCPPELSAAELSDALMEAGAFFVTVSDGDLGTESEQPIFAAHAPGSVVPRLESWDELLEAKGLWRNATLEVGFAPEADVQRALLSIVADAGKKAHLTYSLEDIAPADWVSEVQSNWPPVSLAGCLTIRFPWHTAADVEEAQRAANIADGAEPGPTVVLHPGMAFGTGEHATTQLCCASLRALLAPGSELAGCEVLDYGSGSGVLSFAALRFGAAAAVAVEIDVDTIAASRLNAALNVDAAGEPLADSTFVALEPEEEAARGAAYSLVVANILAGTLIELAELLAERVAPGGTLLCSGVWGEEQAARVVAEYTPRGFGEFDVEYSEGGWAVLCATKGGA